MAEKIFYLEPERTTLKTSVLKMQRKEGKTGLSFPETIFFPTGGGQPSDRGFIRGEGWVMVVEEVSEEEEIWHWGKITGLKPQPGEEVEMQVDEEWRGMMCEQHTAQHLFSAILERDYALSTTGFSILADGVKIEVPSFGELSSALLEEAERKVRLYIAKRLPVRVYWENQDRRIVEIPGLDLNPCGGLHVGDTGFIRCFAVLRHYRKNRDFWRIEFVAGRKLEEALRRTTKTMDALRVILGKDLIESARRSLQKGEDLEKELRRLKEELLNARVELLVDRAEEKEGGKILVQSLPYNLEELRILAKKLGEKGLSSVLVNDEGQLALVALSSSWGERVVTLLKAHGFRGMSAPHFAQGKIENPPSFLQAIRGI